MKPGSPIYEFSLRVMEYVDNHPVVRLVIVAVSLLAALVAIGTLVLAVVQLVEGLAS